MKITIDIPDAQKDRAITALCGNYGYQPKLADGTDNPETPAAFSRRMVIEFIKNHVQAYETRIEQEKAAKPADIDIT